MKTSRNYQDSLVTALRDPEEAAAYLDAALEAGGRPAFLLAMRNVIDALGGMSRIARNTGLNRENLYRVLSEKGNPELNSLEKLTMDASPRSLSISYIFIKHTAC